MLKLIVFALLSVAADANFFVDIWRRLTHGTTHVAFGSGGSFQYAGEQGQGSSLSPSSASGGGGNEVVYGYYSILSTGDSPGSSPGSSSGNSPGNSPGSSGNSVYGPFIATGSTSSNTPSTNTDATPASNGNAEANELAALSTIQGPSANPNVRNFMFVLKLYSIV